MTDLIDMAIERAQIRLDRAVLELDHYRCTLTSLHGKMVRNIRMKPGWEPPSAQGLVYHFALIAQEIDSCEDITDWAQEFDRDLNTPGVVAEFQQKVTDRRDFAILSGQRVYDDLLRALTISQAIDKARPR